MNRFTIISKWLSLTIYTVKFVMDLLLKKNGTNTFSLVNICLRESMDVGQPIFFQRKRIRDEVVTLEKTFLDIDIFHRGLCRSVIFFKSMF